MALTADKKKGFELVQRGVKVRDKGRVSLSKFLPNASSVDLYLDKEGNLLLRPNVEIPASEAWLYKNPEALASVRRGLQQAKKKKFVKSPMKKNSWVDDLED